MSFKVIASTPSHYWKQRQQQYAMNHARSPNIVVIDEKDSNKANRLIAEWLIKNFSDLRIIQMATIRKKNRVYQRVTFQTSSYQRKLVLFDVTASFNNNLNTSLRVFSTRTIIRLWPGTRSIPTRMQIVA
ncbi:hypothetical protein I4U23_003584 [Adineta vaga]|nr:hypothetical protein I4U23_003584 [Adineta vaga]